MGAAFTQTGFFLVNLIFTFYITLVLLRFLLQLVKADFYNPLCQFIVKVTSPLLVPLRRIIPGFFGLDLAAILLAFALQCVEVVLISWISGVPLSPVILIVSVIHLLLLVINIYTFAIIVRALMSWVNPNPYHPLVILLTQLTEPLTRPVRRWIPSISGIDLSPLAVLIVLQIISIFIRNLF